MAGTVLVAFLAACTATADSTATSQPPTATPLITPTGTPLVLQIEEFACVDIYPGAPGSEGHHATASGTAANDAQTQTVDTRPGIVVISRDGELIYEFQSGSQLLSIAPGASAQFSASGELPLAISLDGATCRIEFESDGRRVETTGSSEVAVEVLYAP